MHSPAPWLVPPGKDRAIIDANGNFIGLFASAADADAAVAAINGKPNTPTFNDRLEKCLRDLLGIFDIIEAPDDNIQVSEARAVMAEIEAQRNQPEGGAA